MKLILMDQEFVKLQLKKPKPLPPPSITFCHNMIRLSRSLREAIELKEGDEIILVQDADRPKDFYLLKHPGGYPVRENSSGELRINCVYYWHKVRDLFEVQEQAIKFKVATTPSKLNELEGYAIITVDPLPFGPNNRAGKKAADAVAQAGHS